MKSFTGWVKILDVSVSRKFVVGKHVPVVELLFMGGTFHCYESFDINDAVQVGDQFDSIEFEIQQDSRGNYKYETTHLIRPVDGTIKLNGQLFERSDASSIQK